MVSCRMIAMMLMLAAGTASSRAAPTPASPQPSAIPCLAVMETEVLANLPGEDRKALAGMIDTILTESLAKQKGVQTVDRQALDKLLAEKASQAAGVEKVAPAEVAEKLRPFWAAGAIVCPVVRQVEAPKDTQPGKAVDLVIEVEVVSAQTGQSLGDVHVAAKLQNHQLDRFSALENALPKLWSDLPGNFRQATAVQYIEIADIRLHSSLRRLQWAADAVSDSLRASLARPGIVLLRWRHPMSTKEERLLRVMGLSSPRNGDKTAWLACSPAFRLDAELVEEVGKDLDYDKTPVKLNLSLQGREGPPLKQSFSGMASQYRALSDQSAEWLNKQLAVGESAVDEPRDRQYSRQLAQRELEAARQWEKLCGGWYAYEWHEAGPEQALRVKVLDHAARAAHLDPANEEAARLVVLGIDAPYWLRGAGRSSVCYDRVIAEGERYLDRFGKSPHADEVQGKIDGIAFQWLSEARQAGAGNWIDLPYNPEIWRHAKLTLSQLHRDVAWHTNAPGNLWADAHLVGEAILGHCPPDRLEAERSVWRSSWKKTVEPLKGDVPTWDFIDIFYYIRKKDCAGLRNHLDKLARQYPRSHQYVWGGTRIWEGKPVWKMWVGRWLKQCGDPEWQTWLPSFPTETYDWNLHAYESFLAKFNPAMLGAWEPQDALPLPADRIALEGPSLVNSQDPINGFRPLAISGGFMWLCQPHPGERLRRGLPLIPSDRLLLAAIDALKAKGTDLHVKTETIQWPPHPSDGRQGAPGKAVRCWLATVESGVPTVWIGTAWHGLARFDRKNGEWRGRWYGDKEGIPGDDVLVVRPCLHQGKPKLLLLSQQPPPLGAQQWPAFLWVLDPADGKIISIATGKWWGGWVSQSKNSPNYFGGAMVWKNGTKTPLCVYDRGLFPKLDASDIVGLEWQYGNDFISAQEGNTRHIWSWTPTSLTMWDGLIGNNIMQYDERMRSQPLLDCRSMNRDICYIPAGFAPDLEGIAPYRYNYDPSRKGRFLGQVASGQHAWRVLRAPSIDLECCSNQPALIWGNLPWSPYSGVKGVLLTAYQPTGRAPLDENDAWYGPWRTEMAIESLDFIDGYLWLVTSGSKLFRFKPAAALEAAKAQGAVQSTAQWRSQYYKRIESNWLDAVRLHISMQEYDKALARIAAARRAISPSATPAVPTCHFDLWEALALAKKGDLAAADRLYLHIADDPKAEPFARGVALVSLVGVRYAAKNWSGLEPAIDKLVALFPELDAPNPFSCHETIDWYRSQPRLNSETGTTAVTPKP